jgi:hemolysin activation/secretion protein
LNSELKPGLKPGEAVLDVRVQEASPFRAWVEFNNFQSPTVGAERGSGTIAVDNPFGIGDQFQFTYGGSSGVNPLVDTRYSLPLTPWDTTLELQYRKNDFNVVSSAFKQLDIESESQIFKVSLRQPLYRTLTDEVAVILIGEHLQNQNFIGGTGFSFTPGTTGKGKSKVTALRFAQEWVHRQPTQVFAFYSRFSLGIDALNATNNRTNKHDPDAHFFAWLGQAQLARRIDLLDIQLISSLALQVSNDSLFPLEQFAVGGRYSVRGYRENQLVRDNAFLFSIEPRIPVLPSLIGPQVTVHFAPFIDVGRSWNAKTSTPTPKTLASIGVGLRLGFFDRAFANVYWGQQLNHVSDTPPGGNLQDHGFHVQFILNIL